MKIILYFFTFVYTVCTNSSLFSQSPTFSWAHKWGNANNDAANSVITDNKGNLYTTGYFDGSVYFGLNPINGINITSNGANDICIAKLNASGNYIWVKQIGGIQSERGLSIAVDNSGNVYTTGFFMDTVDFDPGPGVFSLSTQAGNEVFISKLDSSGNFVWANKFEGLSSNVGGNIEVDNAGNIYISGYFKGLVDFDPSINSYNLTSDHYSHDLFISKLDSNGQFIWAKKIGGSGLEEITSTDIDNTNNLYITGSFERTVDFNPSVTGVANRTAAGWEDVFIAKFDSSGDFKWVKNFSGLDREISYGIALNSSGDIYTTGFFQDTVDFDPGPSVYNMVANSFNDDMFISKLDSNGNFLWAKEFNGSSFCIGSSIDVDEMNNINLVGYFAGTTDFDASNNITNLTSNGSQDVFVASYDSLGNFIWGKSMGGTGSDEGLDITIDKNNDIYTSGIFMNTIDFNPYSGSYYMASSGAFDAFIHKFNSLTVGTFEQDLQKKLVVYPNPCKGKLALLGEVVGEKAYLYSISGQLIQKFNLDKNAFSQEFNLGRIENGVYFLFIPGKFQDQQLKVVKNGN